MKKWIAVILSAILVLMAASCGQTPSEPGQEKNTGQDEETVTPLELTIERTTDEEYDDDVLIYAGIHERVRLSEEDAAAYPALAAALEAVSEAETSEMARIKEDLMQQYLEMGELFTNFADELKVEVIRSDSRIVSIRQDLFTNTGGAHPMYGSYGLNIDTVSGGQLLISDVISDMDVFIALTEQKLREFYEEVFCDRPEPFLEGLAEEQYSWTMDYEGINLYFSPYVIAPYAAGMQEVAFAFEEYPDLFDEKWFAVN